MRFLWSSALKDLRRRARDPLSLALWVGIPVLVAVLLNIVFGGRGATPRGLLLIADQDQSLASSLLAGAFSQGRLGEMIAVEKVDREKGRARLDQGDGSALLVIPKGFGKALLRNEPFALNLVTNPAQRIAPRIIEETLSILTDAAFYIQLLLGNDLRTLADGPPGGAKNFPDRTISDISVTVNRLATRLQRYLDPPLIELKTTVIEEKGSGASFDFAAAFFTSMLFFALLFIAQGLSEDIWKESSQGTLRRMATTPRRLEAFFAGKVLAAGLLIAMVSLSALLAARWIQHIRFINFLPALGWLTLAGTGLFLLMVLAQLYASGERVGSILTNIVVFPLALLGGSFFPFEVMPEGLAAIGRLTPNGWAIVQFKAILGGSAEIGTLAAAVAGVLAWIALVFFLGVRRLRRAFVSA